jgi:hypothetical protein
MSAQNTQIFTVVTHSLSLISLATVLCVPFFFYPRYLPGTAHIRRAKQAALEAQGGGRAHVGT